MIMLSLLVGEAVVLEVFLVMVVVVAVLVLEHDRVMFVKDTWVEPLN